MRIRARRTLSRYAGRGQGEGSVTKSNNSSFAEEPSPQPSPGAPGEGAKSFDFGGEIVWRASPELIAQSNLKRFMSRHGISSFNELLRRSTEDIGWFGAPILAECLKLRLKRRNSPVSR